MVQTTVIMFAGIYLIVLQIFTDAYGSLDKLLFKAIPMVFAFALTIIGVGRYMGWPLP